MSRTLNIDEEVWREAWKTLSGPEMAAKFGISVRQVHNRNRVLGLVRNSEHTTAGMKKRGWRSPIGSTYVYNYRKHVKTEDGWKPMAAYNWLKKEGKDAVPKNCIIGFLDDDPMNCEPENLYLIDRAERKKEKLAAKAKAREERIALRSSKKIKKKRPRRSAKKIKAEKIKIESRRQVRLKRQMAQAPVVKAQQKNFKIKAVDLNDMQSVRIDARTTIYIRMGDDPQAAIEKYYSQRKNKIA